MDIATAPAPIDNSAGQSAPLQLMGSLARPLSLSLEALRQYPAVTGPAFDLRLSRASRLVCSHADAFPRQACAMQAAVDE